MLFFMALRMAFIQLKIRDIFIYAPTIDFCVRLNRLKEVVLMYSTICATEQK